MEWFTGPDTETVTADGGVGVVQLLAQMKGLEWLSYPGTDEGVGVVVTFDPGTDEGGGVVKLPLTLTQMKGSVTFDPGTDEGVGVVKLALSLAQMKGLEWLLPLTLAQMKGLEWLSYL